MLNGVEPVMSTYRQSTMDGAGYYIVGWRELTQLQERIRFSRAYARQSFRSCNRDRTSQEGVEDSAKGIDIRTTTRFPAKLFRRSKVERLLLSGRIGDQVRNTTEVNELRRSRHSSNWHDDVGRFDVTMDQMRMLPMQIAYSVHNGCHQCQSRVQRKTLPWHHPSYCFQARSFNVVHEDIEPFVVVTME